MTRTPTPLKPGQKRRYAARVHDLEGDHPLHHGDWFLVTTRANPTGLYGTRAQAQEVLETAVKLYHHGKLAGHTTDIVVDAEHITVANIKVDDYLTGNVVPIASVPSEFRAQYRDTLARAAMAAHLAGVVLHVNSSFRTRAEQVVLHNKYLAGGPLAARPGTSPHERGIALDIPNVRLMPTVIAEMSKLDLHDDVPSEVWHITNHHRVA